MTTLNTIIEEEKKEFDKYFRGFKYDEGMWPIKDFLTTAMQRAYEAGVKDGKRATEPNKTTTSHTCTGTDRMIVYNGKVIESNLDQNNTPNV